VCATLVSINSDIALNCPLSFPSITCVVIWFVEFTMYTEQRDNQMSFPRVHEGNAIYRRSFSLVSANGRHRASLPKREIWAAHWPQFHLAHSHCAFTHSTRAPCLAVSLCVYWSRLIEIFGCRETKMPHASVKLFNSSKIDDGVCCFPYFADENSFTARWLMTCTPNAI
jgi:hypothetical protein